MEDLAATRFGIANSSDAAQHRRSRAWSPAWFAKARHHWPLIDYECGPGGLGEPGADTFIKSFYRAERGAIDPFVLVVEGSIPNEKIKAEGHWAAFGNNFETVNR